MARVAFGDFGFRLDRIERARPIIYIREDGPRAAKRDGVRGFRKDERRRSPRPRSNAARAQSQRRPMVPLATAMACLRDK